MKIKSFSVFLTLLTVTLSSCGDLGFVKSELNQIFKPENKVSETPKPVVDNKVASDISYLTVLEKDVITELNKVRANPAEYAKTQVAKIKTYYKGKLIEYPDATGIMSVEGVAAVDECYNELLATQPM